MTNDRYYYTCNYNFYLKKIREGKKEVFVEEYLASSLTIELP